MRPGRWWLWLIFVVAGTAVHAHEPILKSGDRVVFLGDSICFGMNDGRVAPFTPPMSDTFMAGMSNLVATLSAANTRRMVCPVFWGRDPGQH